MVLATDAISQGFAEMAGIGVVLMTARAVAAALRS